MGLMGNQPCVCGDSASAHRNPAHACDAGRYTPAGLPLTTGEGNTARELTYANDAIVALAQERDEAQALADRLREQLDALTKVAKPLANLPYPMSKDERTDWLTYQQRLRAALGVEGPAE